MAHKITISPITRINGFWRLDVQVENGQIIDAYSSGIYIRGLEQIMQRRDPQDAVYLTQRICGICSSAHALTGSLALENAYDLEIPKNAIIIRNLIFGADLLQNHLRHFYFLSLPDFAEGPDEAPFVPRYQANYRFSKQESEKLYEHYMESIEVSRLCHEMLTIFGGKAPHNHGILIGGASVHPTADNIRLYLSRLKVVKTFIKNRLLPDVELLAEKYADYFLIGQGPEVLLSYGMFPREDKRGEFYLRSGVMEDQKYRPLEPQDISEHVKYSWFDDRDATSDIMTGQTTFKPDKKEAYSWVKAPRYQGKVVQTGPVVRLHITGDYRRGISTIDRLYGRCLEAKKVADYIEDWLYKLEPGKPIYQEYKPLRDAKGIGLMEAMRGGLGHWVEVEDYHIKSYQIITPSSWNMSPRDDEGQLGAVEQALIGTPIADIQNPIEVGRVARSFDPCSSCAAQVYSPEGSLEEFII